MIKRDKNTRENNKLGSHLKKQLEETQKELEKTQGINEELLEEIRNI